LKCFVRYHVCGLQFRKIRIAIAKADDTVPQPVGFIEPRDFFTGRPSPLITRTNKAGQDGRFRIGVNAAFIEICAQHGKRPGTNAEEDRPSDLDRVKPGNRKSAPKCELRDPVYRRVMGKAPPRSVPVFDAVLDVEAVSIV
jgi:hypothetical protein